MFCNQWNCSTTNQVLFIIIFCNDQMGSFYFTGHWMARIFFPSTYSVIMSNFELIHHFLPSTQHTALLLVLCPGFTTTILLSIFLMIYTNADILRFIYLFSKYSTVNWNLNGKNLFSSAQQSCPNSFSEKSDPSQNKTSLGGCATHGSYKIHPSNLKCSHVKVLS